MLSKCFTRKKIILHHAKNDTVWDTNGKSYIDFAGGRSTSNFGHCHPKIVRAIQEQAEKLIHYTNDFYMEIQNQYSDALEKFIPFGLNCFFIANSGAETVEGSLKLARAATGKTRILSLEKGFHGRTFGALSATANANMKKPFFPLVSDISNIENNIDVIENELSKPNTAAIILEPVQGEAGVYPVGDDVIKDIRRISKKFGVLMILDEIQTGFGRCGKKFYCERIEVAPDILLASKSIAGGLPFGIVASSSSLDFKPGEHGGTFSGYPLGCAAALAALEVFEEEKLGERSIEIEKQLKERLSRFKDLKAVKEIRVIGALAGIEFDPQFVNGESFINSCLDKGLLANITKNVIRLIPPLTIKWENLYRGIDIIYGVLSNQGN